MNVSKWTQEKTMNKVSQYLIKKKKANKEWYGNFTNSQNWFGMW
jgi:hypothetical protein